MNIRQSEILGFLAANGQASAVELAERFEVSVMTIRRDLLLLENKGELTRTHGGAVLSRAGILEFSYREKGKENATAKKAIAKEVSTRIRPGMSITLDTGTTTLEVAKCIAGTKDLTVLTSSLAVTSALYAHENIDLVLLGGSVRKGNPDLSGWLTEDNLKNFQVDLAVLGADAVDQNGILTTDASIARVSQAMRDSACETLLAIDHTKFSKAAFIRYAQWRAIDSVVTGDAVPASVRDWLEKAVANVVYVET